MREGNCAGKGDPVLSALSRLMQSYSVDTCVYGHLHGATHRRAFEGLRNATDYALISADYLGFNPKKICE